MNSIICAGSNCGSALAGLSVVAINRFGWRVSQKMTGIAGILVAVLGFLAIKEPKRTIVENETESVRTQIKSSFKEIAQNPVLRYCAIA